MLAMEPSILASIDVVESLFRWESAKFDTAVHDRRTAASNAGAPQRGFGLPCGVAQVEKS
jgi:hypothetical protein